MAQIMRRFPWGGGGGPGGSQGADTQQTGGESATQESLMESFVTLLTSRVAASQHCTHVERCVYTRIYRASYLKPVLKNCSSSAIHSLQTE